MVIRPQSAPSGGRMQVGATREQKKQAALSTHDIDTPAFDPADRVVRNVVAFKQYLQDNASAVPVNDPVRMAVLRNRRPNTAALSKHKQLWDVAQLKTIATSKGKGTGTWKSVNRDLDLFSKRVTADGKFTPGYLQQINQQRKKTSEVPKSTQLLAGRFKMSPPDGLNTTLNDAYAKYQEKYVEEHPTEFPEEALEEVAQTRRATTATATAASSAQAMASLLKPKQGGERECIDVWYRGSVSMGGESTLMKYFLAFERLRHILLRHTRRQCQQLFHAVEPSEGLDIGGRGGANSSNLHVLRIKTFNEKVKTSVFSEPQRVVIFRTFDIFHDGWIAHAPFVAALRCIDDPTAANWIAFLFTCLSSHASAFHIAEFHSALRVLSRDIIKEHKVRNAFGEYMNLGNFVQRASARDERWGNASSAWMQRWSMRRDPVVVEFRSLQLVLFATTEMVQWKDARLTMLDTTPCLAEIVLDRKL